MLGLGTLPGYRLKIEVLMIMMGTVLKSIRSRVINNCPGFYSRNICVNQEAKQEVFFFLLCSFNNTTYLNPPPSFIYLKNL